MGKDNDDFIKSDKSKEPVEWVCDTDCYCSDNGDPIRSRMWHVGQTCWQIERPSKHFMTRDDYNNGANGRAKYFKLYTEFGGIMNEKIRALPLDVLKQVVEQTKRDFLRRQARSS